jgi:hypothetical protein
MRRIFVAIGLFLAMTVASFAAATVFDTPKALLDYAYAPYATGNFKDDNQLLYSSALNALFATAAANTPDDDVGPVDFDVFVNGQDYQLSELKIGDPMPEGAGVSVPVTFKNFADAQSLLFHLVKEGGGWKINDIESKTPGEEWKLTDLLTPAPDDGSDDAAGSDGNGAADNPADTPAPPAN